MHTLTNLTALALASTLLVACVGAPDTAEDGSATTDDSLTFNPEAGWTAFPQQAGGRTVYVSTSGNDHNDGKTQDRPVRTLKHAASLLTPGHPDRLLLKRGDTWTDETLFTDTAGAGAGRNGVWKKSGKPGAPMVIAYYGDMSKPRPTLKTGVKSAISALGTVNYVSIIGLHFSSHTRDPKATGFHAAPGYAGIDWHAATDGLLIEDVLVEHYQDAVVVEGASSGSIKNVKIRRSVLVDSYQLDNAPIVYLRHSEGIYADNVTNLVIEENVLDHNGWAAGVAHAEKTIFNHDIYVQVFCQNVTVQRNILARASSHGLQMRPGGTVADNLFVQDALGMSFGLVNGEHGPLGPGVTGEVAGNVILDGADIDPNSSGLRRGTGIEMGNIKAAEVHGNIIAHDASVSTYGRALSFTHSEDHPDIGLHNLEVHDNVVYDWGSNLVFDVAGNSFGNVTLANNKIQAPDLAVFLLETNGGGLPSGVAFSGNTWSGKNDDHHWFQGTASFSDWVKLHEKTAHRGPVHFKDAARSIARYSQSRGKAASFDAFIAEARKQAHGNYRQDWTTPAVLAYFRDGFTVIP